MNRLGDVMMNSLDSILLQKILQYGNVGIHVIDNSRKTIIYNSTMAQLEGLEIEQVIGKDLFEIFPSLNEETSTLIKVLKTGESIFNSTQTYLNFRGHSITTISSTIPLIENKKIIGAAEIAHDLTNTKILSDQLLELQNELKKDNKGIKPTIKKYSLHNIIGQNEKLIAAKKIAQKACQSPSSVLIFGETGTGKEMFAQSIHYNGNRKDKTFIAQNCAAIPDTLLEGILFGTEKGGFTGAIEREGIFEQANGGTLLLDEINSMSLTLQAKLLRVLQEGYIRRVGGIRDIPIDVRIIATTNENPMDSIENGTLRKDLYYRLNVININIPPLRERLDDIELLTYYFVAKYNKILNKNISKVSSDVIRDFKNYNWPGNVRELENFIEGAMNMVSFDDKALNKEDFLSSNFLSNSRDKFIFSNFDSQTLPEMIGNIEQRMIYEALKINNYNISNAASFLGIKRQTLQAKIKKYNLMQK